MRRTIRVSASGLLLTTILAAPAMAQDATAPGRIDLPPGWQPEGVTTDGTSLFVGSLADGAIWKADPASGEGGILAPGAEGMVSVGIDAEPDRGRLWVAGGPTGAVRAVDIESGDVLETYQLEAGFLNDVAVTGDAVYVTDSFMPQLIVIPLPADGSLAPPDAAEARPVSGDLEYGEGFNLNGIVATEAGLVTVHSPTGTLYRLDPSGATTAIDTGGADLTAGDGLELAGSTLYVVRNQLGIVAVLELDPALGSATATGEITSADVDVPTTVALVGDSLWAANARFGTDPTPETEYWLTRLPAQP